MPHCCRRMADHLDQRCEMHSDPYDCPDQLIAYTPKFDEYGLIVHDGGSSMISIQFCPWCGTKLPESKFDRWLAELKALGFDDPFAQEIPEAYKSDAWYRS